MTLISELMADHRSIRNLLDRLEKATPATRDTVLIELGRTLVIHATAEEKLIYPLLERTALKKEARHAYEEHHLISVQFDEIAKLDADNHVAKDKAHVLKEIVTHHLDEEEEDVFPLLEKSLSDQDMAALAETYPAYREQLEQDFEEYPPQSCQEWSLAHESHPHR